MRTVAGCIVATLLLGALARAQGVTTIHTEVKTSYDKKVDFAAFKTYSWDKGQEAFDPAAHTAIVAAVDADLAALGLTRQNDRKGDVIVRYHSVMRTDVDVKHKNKGEATGPTRDVGRVLVELRDGKSFKQIWRATSEDEVSRDPSARAQDIRRGIDRLFESYPTRKKPG